MLLSECSSGVMSAGGGCGGVFCGGFACCAAANPHAITATIRAEGSFTEITSFLDFSIVKA
jgi:hypothetical protein